MNIRQPLSLKHSLVLAAGAAAAAAGAVLLYFSPPGRSWYLPPCPLHELTGLYCSGCGTTRSFYALLHGRFAEAATWNLLLYPALLLVALLLFRPRLALNRYLCVSVLAVILIYWVLRNLPWSPFTLLAPH